MALVIQDAYHELLTGNVALGGVALPDAIHFMASDSFDITQAHTLTVAACEHRIFNDLCTPIEPNPLTTPWTGLNLPTLSSTGSTDTKIDCALLGLNLPVPIVSIEMGARMESNLPTLSVSATAATIIQLEITSNLPTLSASGEFGAQAFDLKMPTLTCDAQIYIFSATFEKTLPGLTISAEGYRERVGTLYATLPVIIAEATGSRDFDIGMLDLTLPAMTISATGSADANMSMTATLPDLRISSDSGVFSGYGTVISMLPYLYLQSSGKDIDPTTDPYDDYVLRYVR